MNGSNDKVGYREASEATGLKGATLYSMVSRKQIPHYRLGKRLVVFSLAELKQWMADRRIPTETGRDEARR
jgi:excisionase family DNA binding protein